MSYKNNYRREHSDFLKKHFAISPNGVDFHNDNNLAIEFKESFRTDYSDMFFKIKGKQLEQADLVVFCEYSDIFHVVLAKDIKEYYKGIGLKNYAIRINPVKMLSLLTTNSIETLENFIKSVDWSDLK